MKVRIVMLIIVAFLASSVSGQTTGIDSMRKTKQERLSLPAEIELGLKRILDKYRNEPDTESSWKQIRGEADSYLYAFFKSGRLRGRTTKEAYFTQIGLQTMSASDIAAGRKILVAGIAELKPAEFTIIRVETSRTTKK